MKKLNYKLIEKDNKRYLECDSSETPIRFEQDAIDLISACFEHDTNLIILHSEVLTEDFFKLGTGLAGQVLQKFINYRIKAAVVLSDDQQLRERFKELILESNQRNDFRVYAHISEAEKWLLDLEK
jgi:hypothetical protein